MNTTQYKQSLPVFVELFKIIRKEGIQSDFLTKSARDLYNDYLPLKEQFPDLDLSNSSSQEYSTFAKFWYLHKNKLKTELNCHNPTTKITSSFIGYSPAPRVGNSDLTEDELEIVMQVIKEGSDCSRIAEAARLHRSNHYSDPSEAENLFEDCKSVHRMGRCTADITKLKSEHSVMSRIIPRVEEKVRREAMEFEKHLQQMSSSLIELKRSLIWKYSV